MVAYSSFVSVFCGVTIPCPHCSEPVSVEDAGLFPCPNCGKPFEVSGEAKTPAASPTVSDLEFAKRVLTRWRDNMANPKPRFICTVCGTTGDPVTRVKGSLLLEIALYLFCFLIGGIIYSVWRLTTRDSVCRRCQGKVIPIDSPAGSKLWEQYRK
jgi:ribosomal protein L37AE/L43A